MTSAPRIGITVDCPDPESAAAFWERFVGYERRRDQTGDVYVTLDRVGDADGPPHLTFQRVPEPKTVKARIHLDLFVDHAQPMVDDVVAAGATVVETTAAGEWTTRIPQTPPATSSVSSGPIEGARADRSAPDDGLSPPAGPVTMDTVVSWCAVHNGSPRSGGQGHG